MSYTEMAQLELLNAVRQINRRKRQSMLFGTREKLTNRL